MVCWFAALWMLLGVTQAAAADRPNILWITAEDMSATLGCYGDDYAATSNIDGLASESVRYTQAFATAPVCSPSRCCLITGCYAASLGTHQMRSAFPIPAFIRGFPSLLREDGYYTSNHVKTDYNNANADEIIAASWNENSDTAHWRNRPGRGVPFFSVFNIMTSHQSRSMVWTQDRFRDEVQSQLSDSEIHAPEDAPVPAYYPDTLVTRRIVARYYDCVSVMDKQVGTILRQLEEDGLADDTIVFFYSDHGSGMPRHKRLLHDSGMHVPLLVRFPKKFAHLAPVDPGESTDQLVSFVDFGPTVLALAGVETPDYMQGVPFLASRSESREYVFGHRDRIDEVVDLSRSVRDKRYLYIRNYMPHLGLNQVSAYPDMSEIRHELYRLASSNAMSPAQRHYVGPSKPVEELYDCHLDPQNLENLAKAANHQEVLTRMRAKLHDQIGRISDMGFIPESLAAQLFGTQSQNAWRMARRASWQTHLDAWQSAERQLDANADQRVAMLRAADPSTRYWGAIGLAALKSIEQGAAGALAARLRDEVAAVRIESAHALARHGRVAQALPVLTDLLSSPDLNVVLHAARTIELLGDAFPSAMDSAVPAMEQVAKRADKLQAADTPAVFVQSGAKDLAMFCSFSARGFLQRMQQEDWQELIDRATLKGWSGVDAGQVCVDEIPNPQNAEGDREIELMSAGKNLWIVHEDSFSNFELTVEAKMPTDDYNAGIGFRCRLSDDGLPIGYQCEVADELSGMLFAIRSGGWIWPKGEVQREQFFDDVGAAFRSDKWNHFRIRCVDDHIQIWVNGILATDVRDKTHVTGRVALQHHGKGGPHRYRNVRIRRLNGPMKKSGLQPK